VARLNRVAAIRVAAALVPAAAGVAFWMSTLPSNAIPKGRIEQLTSSRAFEGQPSLSPDGSLVAFRCDYRGNSDICVGTIPATSIRNLTSESTEDESHPSFAPDGQTIAFQSGTRGVFIVPLQGGAWTHVTTTGGSPAWMPDGRSIVYSVATIPGALFREGITEGYVVDVATRSSRRIARVVDFHDPAVSPRGTRIAYTGRQTPRTGRRGFGGASSDLWTVALDGRQAVRVTNDAAIEASPMWSADGRYLYFVSNRNASSAIWRVAIDETTGHPKSRLEMVPTPYSQPVRISRSADGRRIAWADAVAIERTMRIAFDAEARTTRGAPVEIAAASTEPEDPETAGDPRPPVPPAAEASSMPLGPLSFPGRWSPDRALYAGTRAGSLWIYTAAARDYQQLRPGRSPVWLNDSRRLIYASDGKLYLAEAVLKIARELLALADQSLDAPRLSPDNRVLYFAAEGVDANLWLLTADR
jgi:dipeptidyl aminopeptidase/acylaminoacyl peptidase